MEFIQPNGITTAPNSVSIITPVTRRSHTRILSFRVMIDIYDCVIVL
jgi:hypothetical protein